MTEEMKETWRLPENFFKENPLDTPVTAGHLLHFQMQTLMEDDIDDILNRAVGQNFSDNRRGQYLAEQDAINALSSPEDLVRFMKKETDPVNRNLLCKKALDMGDDAATLITERMMRIGIDSFIETAVLILSRSDEKHIDAVAENFLKYRNAYARTAATVLLAYRGRQEALEDIYEEYRELTRSHDEDKQRLSESVLYSIYIMTGRIDAFDEEDLKKLKC